ncbi:cupin domain-containing protein [Blastomonas sp.]|uniref:cupin domain-containing protein n=1 Tax=Blastomonas sp. TaxID=1909299 RepID=UPI00359475E0
MTVHNITTHPVHLGLGAKVSPQPEMTGGLDWYAAYAARTAGDGAEGRLVSQFNFNEPWTMWEMHPAGDEMVLCLSGEIVLHQEAADRSVTSLRLGPGDYAINPPGVWHTADVEGPATALFITAGLGTEHRAR